MTHTPEDRSESPPATQPSPDAEIAHRPGDGEKNVQIVRQLLEQDPFLSYLAETDHLYHVRTAADLALQIPKDRSIPEPYPVERPTLLRQAYYWLWLALFGLLFAGLGAMVFATLAALAALGANCTPISRSDRIRSLVVLLISGGLWLGGLLLGVIFLVHLV
jgi:hypothetical protein